jgi:hypothetical protein
VRHEEAIDFGSSSTSGVLSSALLTNDLSSEGIFPSKHGATALEKLTRMLRLLARIKLLRSALSHGFDYHFENRRTVLQQHMYLLMVLCNITAVAATQTNWQTIHAQCGRHYSVQLDLGELSEFRAD